jgi:hypothetical protein
MTNRFFGDRFIGAIMDTDYTIRMLYNEVIKQLNQEDMDYLIEFKDKVYDFNPPMTKEEKFEIDTQKHEIAATLISDALERIGATLLSCVDKDNPETWKEYRRVWGNLANLQRATKKEYSISTISSAEPYEVDEGTSKDLDYDSVYVQAQRKDLSDEQKWNLLLNISMVKQERSAKDRADSGS